MNLCLFRVLTLTYRVFICKLTFQKAIFMLNFSFTFLTNWKLLSSEAFVESRMHDTAKAKLSTLESVFCCGVMMLSQRYYRAFLWWFYPFCYYESCCIYLKKYVSTPLRPMSGSFTSNKVTVLSRSLFAQLPLQSESSEHYSREPAIINNNPFPSPNKSEWMIEHDEVFPLL